MRFIELTYNDGCKVWVNADAVTSVAEVRDKTSTARSVVCADNDGHYVLELPREVVSRLELAARLERGA